MISYVESGRVGDRLIASDELQLIKQVLDGDKTAFEALVIANEKNVYNLALKMTGNDEDALDISQEAFLKAYTKIGSFRGESRFSVWLYRLTYNLCIDFIRKKPRAQVISLTYQDDAGDTYEMEAPDTRNIPEDVILRREKRKTVAESINELGDKHREILVMREMSAMSYEEIASVLRISEGTVKSRLARARKSLANILVSKGTFPENCRLKGHEEVGKSD